MFHTIATLESVYAGCATWQVDGGRSSAGRAPGCDPGCRGFESHRPPQFAHREAGGKRRRQKVSIVRVGPLAQLVEQETLNLLVVGSIPTRPIKFNNLVTYDFNRSPGATQVLLGR